MRKPMKSTKKPTRAVNQVEAERRRWQREEREQLRALPGLSGAVQRLAIGRNEDEWRRIEEAELNRSPPDRPWTFQGKSKRRP